MPHCRSQPCRSQAVLHSNQTTPWPSSSHPIPPTCHPPSAHMPAACPPAGASQHAAAEDTSPQVAAALLSLNLEGPLGLARATLPLMAEQGRGQHVVVASMSGQLPWLAGGVWVWVLAAVLPAAVLAGSPCVLAAWLLAAVLLGVVLLASGWQLRVHFWPAVLPCRLPCSTVGPVRLGKRAVHAVHACLPMC